MWLSLGLVIAVSVVASFVANALACRDETMRYVADEIGAITGLSALLSGLLAWAILYLI